MSALQGVSAEGLQRMARIAAGIAGDLGDRDLCRHSAFFAGLSEVLIQSLSPTHGTHFRVSCVLYSPHRHAAAHSN